MYYDMLNWKSGAIAFVRSACDRDYSIREIRLRNDVVSTSIPLERQSSGFEFSKDDL